MRGIEARCELAMSRVLMPFDTDTANNLGSSAMDEAQGQGMWDYKNGITTPPAQFAGEPELLEQWHWGQTFSFDRDQMAACPMCQDREMPLCQLHD